MAKTADVHQSIWGDPWFLALAPDAKLLYLWAITNQHSNLAGLYVIAKPMIQVETGLMLAGNEEVEGDLVGWLHELTEDEAVQMVVLPQAKGPHRAVPAEQEGSP